MDRAQAMHAPGGAVAVPGRKMSADELFVLPDDGYR